MTLTPDDYKVICASARKISSDANMIVNKEVRNDIKVEAAAIITLCERFTSPVE